jgi:hypothetical protein
MLKYASCSNDTKGRICLSAAARENFFVRAMVYSFISLSRQSRLASAEVPSGGLIQPLSAYL